MDCKQDNLCREAYLRGTGVKPHLLNLKLVTLLLQQTRLPSLQHSGETRC